MGRVAQTGGGGTDTPARAVPAEAPAHGSEGLRSYIGPTVFSTEAFPAGQQFDAWQGRRAPLIALEPVPRPAPGFPARNVLWDLGAFVLSSVVAPGLRFERLPGAPRQAVLDHWMVGYSRRGTTTIRAGGRTATAAPGVPYACSLGCQFDGERTDLDWSALFLPRDGFEDIAARLDAAHGTTLASPLGLLLADFLRGLEAHLVGLTRADLPGIEAMIRVMLAASLPVAHDGDAAGPELDVARREQIRRLIRVHLATVTLGPRSLCRLAGISRSTLYRLFQDEGGVAGYIQRVRLRRAHAALATPNEMRPIQAIAERVGFADASVFSRAFRQEFGCSPRDVRAAAQAGAPLPAIMARPRAAGPSDLMGLLRQF